MHKERRVFDRHCRVMLSHALRVLHVRSQQLFNERIVRLMYGHHRDGYMSAEQLNHFAAMLTNTSLGMV